MIDVETYAAAKKYADEHGGGGGTTNYNALDNKPQIAGTTLQGDKSLADLGIAGASDVATALAGKVDKVEGKGLSTNDYDNTEKGKVADNTSAIEATQDMISDAYDSTHTYNVGDYCIHENVLYKCNTASTTGTWDSSKWDAVAVAEEIQKNSKNIELKKVKIGTAISETLQINNAYNNYYYCYGSEFPTGRVIGYILNNDSANYAYSIMVSLNKLLLISEQSQTVTLVWNPVYIEV